MDNKSFRSLKFWLSGSSGRDAGQRPLAKTNAALRVMSRDPEVNVASLHIASAFLCTMETRGVTEAPVLSIDADGDVVLTWMIGNAQGSAFFSSHSISTVVSQGRRIAHVGEEMPASQESIEQNSFIALGGAGQGWQPNIKSSSMMATVSAGRYLSLVCENPIPTSPPRLIRLSSSSNREAGVGELSRFSGSGIATTLAASTSAE